MWMVRAAALVSPWPHRGVCAVDRSDIADAIVLFQFSQTARASLRATDVVQRLWHLHERNEIGFMIQRKKTTSGSFAAGRDGFDLQVNPQYIDALPAKERLGALSLVVVHEGVHAAVNFAHLYSELAAAMLETQYYRELSGPGVFNEADDPPRPGKQYGIIHIAPDRFPDYREQSDALRKDQLIDYILSIETYTTSRYIDARWIIGNLDSWRGLKNRLPSTKGLYIRILAKRFDPHFSEAILRIMESVERREDWTEMLKEAGPLHTVQLALDDLSARRAFSGRIAALERKWKVRLTERP
jgi:hypothetical protein